MIAPAHSFVYVATGSGYFEEARRSAESLRRTNPGIPICLVTDLDINDSSFDRVIQVSEAEHVPIDKLLAIHCPSERLVFLDTDTRICGDLSPLFEMLDRFDLALHQDVHRGWNYPMEEVPLSFSEFNTGVIAFRNTPEVRSFFKTWRATYQELHERLGLVNDQPSFRRSLYFSDLRVAPLPSEFHFLGNVPNSLMWKVRLIHARGDLECIEQQTEEFLGDRVYLPDVGVLSAFRGRKHWLWQMGRIFCRMTRLLFIPPQDSANANPRKWWAAEPQSWTAPPRDSGHE